MNVVWNSAIGLLLVTGGLLGLTLPFGKLAGIAGVAPAVWALLISLGAGLVLLAAFLLRSGRVRLDGGRLRYFAIVAALSYAIPNLLMFTAMPHLGAGYVGIMFTLTPMLTLVMSILLGFRRPNALGMAGIVVGFAGAVIVATTRGEAGAPASLGWVAVGLAIPLFLASGNIYRSWAWPEGSGPIELAVGSNLAAAVLLAGFIVASGDAGSMAGLAEVPVLTMLQVVSASAMFAFFFRLQAVGGPVYLSQIGYVGAAVGLASGTLFLGESYQALTWLGAVVIMVGVGMTTKAQAG